MSFFLVIQAAVSSASSAEAPIKKGNRSTSIVISKSILDIEDVRTKSASEWSSKYCVSWSDGKDKCY